MVTGQQGNEDTLGPAGLLATERKRERRRRKEQLEEEDSSDLSDDSDDDDKGMAHSIKFDKMPVRTRAKSSPPMRAEAFKVEGLERPSVMVTSASRPQDVSFQRFRSGSVDALETVKQRPRRGTATSSEMSSENELGPDPNKRKLSNRPGKGPSILMEDNIAEEDEVERSISDLDDEEEDDTDVDEASDLSDEYEGTAESPSLFGGVGSSVIIPGSLPKPGIPLSNASPRKGPKETLFKLPKLPPGQRPMSMAQPISTLSMMIRGKNGESTDQPFQRFAGLSGKGETSPLWIKIYAPFSTDPSEAIQVPTRRLQNEKPVTVAELIGLALWRYAEEQREPPLQTSECDINQWTLRIVEDEEVDMDFPPLVRTRPVSDFTSNNNRPPQRRARDKPWDEFGLVKATEQQVKENEQSTPQIHEAGTAAPPAVSTPKLGPSNAQNPLVAPLTPSTSTVPFFNPARNRITESALTQGTQRKDSSTALDLPQREIRQGAPKLGAPRTIVVQYVDSVSFAARTEQIQTTSDSYIAEIFDQSCKRLNLDKALYVLKVHGTQIVAPSDRTVEALGDKLHLDLVRRRFLGQAGGDGMFGLGLSGSPGSSSPNAPLNLTPATATPSQTKRKGMKGFSLHPLAAQQKFDMNVPLSLLTSEGKRYNVLRKQPLSFAATHPRMLILNPEFMTIMPAAPDSLAAPAGKVTNVPMNSIIGAKVSRKHPKMVRILVFREKETKRYDFEAANHREAEAIVADVRRGMEAFGVDTAPS